LRQQYRHPLIEHPSSNVQHLKGNSVNIPYIPGKSPPPDMPLGRFIPPIPAGMVSTWCQENLEQGDWVLDPFGFNPMVPVEIAASGYPVLVTVNNPIHAFMIKVIASAPKADELIAALQDLAVTPKGDERMEPYIRSLYHLDCAHCHNRIEADAFLWKKGAEHPFAAQVDCPFCGTQGEQPITDEILRSMPPLPPKRLHQARALNRIVSRDDVLRPQVENALSAYPIRPLIILQTIINKLESLEQTARRRDLLIALILSAADQGNTLWAHPSPRNRPRQIVIPPVFQERNLWKVLEEAVDSWQVLENPVPVNDWQEHNTSTTGISLFEGRIKELDPVPDDGFFSAVLTAFPRPNQAFWTLSALWTGWIWGQDAVAPIRPVLSRQRYDWNWHTNALRGVFESLREFHHPRIKFWGLIPENEPMLLLAALLAGNAAGFHLLNYAQSLDDQLAQCQWDLNIDHSMHVRPDPAMKVARQRISAYLNEKSEPAAYQQVHAAVVTGLANENMLAIDIFLQSINQIASETQKWIEILFNEGRLLTRVGGGTASLETGNWWLVDTSDTGIPLIDRLEEQIVRHLVQAKTTTAETIKNLVYRALPGLFTPRDEELLICLESYADLVDPKTHQWVLRNSEEPAARRGDVANTQDALRQIADRLHFRQTGKDPISWFDDNETKPRYSFHVFSSAIVSKHISKSSRDAQMKILVLPGSRANLLAFKKQRDPVLAKKLDRDFLVVKFRLVRDLEANPLLSRDLLREQIHADPPEYRSSQLALF